MRIERLELPPRSDSPPEEILSRQVSVGADEALGDELLLQGSEGVPLQHVQPVQQL